MAVEEASSSSGEEGSGGWTREQEKAFENALATTEEEEGDAMWEKIAEVVEGKTAEEVRQHYELLVEDVDGIESGRVPLPVYAGDGDAEEGSGGGGKKGGRGGGHGETGSAKSVEQERRKGIAWTEDEHSVYCDEDKVRSAAPGENVHVKLSGIEEEDITAGFVLSSITNPVGAVSEFNAQLQILELLDNVTLVKKVNEASANLPRWDDGR